MVRPPGIRLSWIATPKPPPRPLLPPHSTKPSTDHKVVSKGPMRDFAPMTEGRSLSVLIVRGYLSLNQSSNVIGLACALPVAGSYGAVPAPASIAWRFESQNP